MTWRERIVAARERGYFTLADIGDAAGNWMTCAVGEQHAALPEVVVYYALPSGRHGGPRDRQLQRLGGAESDERGFGWAVEHQQIDLAERYLDAIEDRVLQLKRELPT